MNIIQRLIPASNKKARPGTRMTPKYITIHETDNPNAGANAEAHARLQERGNDRTASWHLQVDDKQAIQSVPFNEVAWAAGDGSNGPGNTTSIHLEICVNCDGDYKKAVANAAEVTRQLMDTFNIPVDHVVQHNKWSGKNCPSIMRSGKAGITWADFIAVCKAQPAKEGWALESRVWYCYKNGARVKNGWALDSKKLWYYLGEDGAMVTDRWVRWKDKWYYMLSDGQMATGEITVKGKPFSIRENGTLRMTDKDGAVIE